MMWPITILIGLFMLLSFFIYHQVAGHEYVKEKMEFERRANLEFHRLTQLRSRSEEMDKLLLEFEEVKRHVTLLTLKSGFKL